jgi:hypothetical protein
VVQGSDPPLVCTPQQALIQAFSLKVMQRDGSLKSKNVQNQCGQQECVKAAFSLSELNRVDELQLTSGCPLTPLPVVKLEEGKALKRTDDHQSKVKKEAATRQ